MQYQPKLMIQTQERDQNPRILGTFGPILGPEFFFFFKSRLVTFIGLYMANLMQKI